MAQVYIIFDENGVLENKKFDFPSRNVRDFPTSIQAKTEKGKMYP